MKASRTGLPGLAAELQVGVAGPGCHAQDGGRHHADERSADHELLNCFKVAESPGGSSQGRKQTEGDCAHGGDEEINSFH
ncbi:MAG: hypothetical protein K2X77_32815 [Candidatus Obscuribacterales bacterium]|nr:hypothetical protein [Candidatus Obscuribacterales bacterium]